MRTIWILTAVFSFVAVVAAGNLLMEPRLTQAGEIAPAVGTRIVAVDETAQGEDDMDAEHDIAVFGAGCFWGVEAAFRRVDGVVATEVGYCGGTTENPTYKQVCSDATGHAEVVRVQYDPATVGYEQLLDVFWACHDPTQVNRQGPDHGSQYRSVIFWTTEAQRDAAVASKEALDASGALDRPVATVIEEAKPFWRAEEYHQQYLEKRGRANCHL